MRRACGCQPPLRPAPPFFWIEDMSTPQQLTPTACPSPTEPEQVEHLPATEPEPEPEPEPASVSVQAADYAQRPLFDESQFPEGHELVMPLIEQQKRFTGAVLARNRERYLEVVRALGQGLGRRQIARAFGISTHTVQAIFEREPELVATERLKTGTQLRRVVRMSLDALEEALAEGKISAGQLPVATAILLDKSAAWDGQPSQVMVVRHELDQSAVLRAFEDLRSRPATLEAELVPSPDSQSGAMGLDVPQIGVIGHAVPAGVPDPVGRGTSSTTAEVAHPGQGPTEPSAERAASGAERVTSGGSGETGGGGSSFARPAPTVHGFAAGKSELKTIESL
jgi:hypothetical protein